MDFEIRGTREPQGPVKPAREREEYFRLVDQGLGFAEACRVVGINVRTGKRWRNGYSPTAGRKGAPPITAAPSSGPSRHLREADRIHIADRLRDKAGVRTIAAELGRSPS
uniref:helix-turn-helix domain-containing protein n=1 Tax=Embleya scabrispora TaxID=159449 RepID=UPI00131A2F7E|nr:helix-turn-helix domain-containing protein [Streptomyces sp. SID5474]MYS86305.1 helix-turn-helix domain-containing protein [Streptomyces sp. SID5474]